MAFSRYVNASQAAVSFPFRMPSIAPFEWLVHKGTASAAVQNLFGNDGTFFLPFYSSTDEASAFKKRARAIARLEYRQARCCYSTKSHTGDRGEPKAM